MHQSCIISSRNWTMKSMFFQCDKTLFGSIVAQFTFETVQMITVYSLSCCFWKCFRWTHAGMESSFYVTHILRSDIVDYNRNFNPISRLNNFDNSYLCVFLLKPSMKIFFKILTWIGVDRITRAKIINLLDVSQWFRCHHDFYSIVLIQNPLKSTYSSNESQSNWWTRQLLA